MEKRLMTFIACLFLSLGMALAQTQVSGTVVSAEDGEPIIGASIKVAGTNTGTVTDVDGKFSLNVAKNAILEITYIGMNKKEVKATPNMKISMESDAHNLDEVMVVAYGKAKKSSFTGSAAVLKNEKIADRQVTNITQALSGEIAGVQVTQPSGKPGEASTIRVRGIGSWSSSNSPLYVIDGVPYDGNISALNTADIESTTVLKDAASNALYGARGANGVVLITTKKGRSREAEINVDVRLGSSSRALPNYDVIKNPGTYYEKAYTAIYNSVYGTANYPTNEAANAYANAVLPTTGNGGVGYNIFTVPSGENLIGLDGKLNPNATLGYSDGNYTYRPDNWFDEVFNGGNLRQEYNANISGATDKVNYFVSGGYLKDEGIVKNTGFERYSSRAKVDYQAKSWLKLSTNLAYTHYDSNYSVTNKDDYNASSSANIFYVANFMAPIYPLYIRDAQGNIMTDSRGFTMYDYGDAKGLSGYKYKRNFMGGSNPASSGQLDKNSYVADVFSGRWSAEVNLYDGLKFTYNLGLDIDNTVQSVLYNAFYGLYSSQGGVVQKQTERTSAINNQQLLTYVHDFGKHNIDLLLGHETYKWKDTGLWGSKNKLYNPGIIEIDNAILSPQTGSSSDEYSTEGWLARAQYSYDDKYIASASYRRDASSRFAKDSRWGNFGSFGAAWVLTKEDFMANTKSWLNFLKYKISYGIQGNDALMTQDGKYLNQYPYRDIYKVSNNSGDFAVSLYRKGNKDITWETSYSFNTGFDFNLWNGKLSGSVEYYNRLTKNLLYYMPVAVSNGYSVYPTNMGKVRNSGIEIDLNSTVYKTKDIQIDLYANATTWKNKIIKLDESLKGQMIDGSRIYKEGESMYQYYMRSYAGVYNGDETELAPGASAELGEALYYIDVKDENGNVTRKKTSSWSSADRYAQGDCLPSVYGGFGVRVAAYGVDFSIAAAYQLGGKAWDYGYQLLMHGGSATDAGTGWSKDIDKAWTPENTNTNVPRLNSNDQYTNATSDRWLTSSDYLSLTNLSLGYSFPKSLLNKIKLNGLRVYFTADNVALFAKRKGFDPRQSFGQSTNMQYSAVRTISGGISVKF